MVPLPGTALTARSAWRPVDRLLAGYGGLIAAIALTRIDQRGMPWIVAAHLALIALAWLAAHAGASRRATLLRATYPVLLLPGLYSSIDVLNGFGAAPTWDAPLLVLEQRLFGMQPSRDWWQRMPSATWSAVLHTAYFAYYVVVPLPVVVFLAGGHRDAVDRYLTGVIAVFLACYVCYVIAPVSGPYYQFAHPTGVVMENAPARLVYAMLARGSAYGAAFPSSHVAATVAATVLAWRVMPRLGLLLLVPTVLLVVGVVYCQMHYVVDVVAGVAIGAGLPIALRRLTPITARP